MPGAFSLPTHLKRTEVLQDVGQPSDFVFEQTVSAAADSKLFFYGDKSLLSVRDERAFVTAASVEMVESPPYLRRGCSPN